MAKRLVSILLLFLYLIPSIGVSGSVHYCGGEIAAVVIIPTNEHPCACGPSEPMEDGCCKDKNFSIKIKDNHKNDLSKLDFNHSNGSACIEKPYAISNKAFIIFDEKVSLFIKEKEPPDIKLFVLYDSFLI